MVQVSQYGIKTVLAQFHSIDGSYWIELRTIDKWNEVCKEIIHFANAAYAEAIAKAINSVPQPETTEEAAAI